MTPKTKTNLTQYQGKSRIYIAHGTISGLSRILAWDARLGRYEPPSASKAWVARKSERSALGLPERLQRTFETFDAAKAWLQEGASIAQDISRTKSDRFEGSESFESIELLKPDAKTFEQAVEQFRRRRYPQLSRGSCLHYDQLLRLHFGPLMKVPMADLTPKAVDAWIDWLIENLHRYPQARLRKSFDKELTLLGVILRYYDDHQDDPTFRFPIKGRHRRAVVLRREDVSEDRDLSFEEFLRVRDAFDGVRSKYAVVCRALFVFQFRQALRISEAAVVHWEDIRLDFREPPASTVRICRHVEFSKVTGVESRITPGFKNSKGLGGAKEQPLFPESFQALKSLHFIGCKGLVFQDGEGSFLSYRTVQETYRRAFEAAGIPYKGTHQLRHGGCRVVYNRTADMAVASQILGNEDPDTVKVYAKRDRKALTEVALKEWAAVTAATVGEAETSSL